MNIFKTMAFFSNDDNGKIYLVDTISYEGKMWLVPEWLDNPRGGWRKPTRIILLDILPHQKTQGGDSHAHFVLNHGIPKSVFFDGQIPPQPEDYFVVIEGQDIQFPAIGG